MKKMVKSIVAAACVCALFAGCGKAPEEAAKVVPPEEVALDYMKSMQSGKVDEAYLKEHCTENAVKIIGELLSSGKEGVMSELKGIKFRPNTYIGTALTIDDLLRDGYQSVFVGAGLWKPRKQKKRAWHRKLRRRLQRLNRPRAKRYR